MSRPRSEIEFGSDSFLDIIANLVGILIILTVVAGLRVSRAPVGGEDEPVAIQTPAVAATIEPEPFDPEALIPPRVVRPEPEPVEAPPAPRVAPRPSPELLRSLADARKELEALERETARQAEQTREIAAQEQALRGRLGENRDALAAAQKDAEQGEHLLRDLHGSVTSAKVQLRNLEAELEQVRQEKEPVTMLQHRMTALAREVNGKELHFQLIGNQVAYVPVDELVERLKAQIQKQKDWLLKFPRHQGKVGPIGGFTMDYVVERSELSFAERMSTGVGVMQIRVSQFVVQPEPDLPAERFDEALSSGSLFLRTLRGADLDATLTFWVYPDSFGMYRRLAEICHREGFTVAARPMPFGVPIAGSPHGTRSAGQ